MLILKKKRKPAGPFTHPNLTNQIMYTEVYNSLIIRYDIFLRNFLFPKFATESITIRQKKHSESTDSNSLCHSQHPLFKSQFYIYIQNLGISNKIWLSMNASISSQNTQFRSSD